ncbi:hypothetical protein PISL3812_06873 [Talaromyces islandicus]|uniref:DUF3074 domain-containing protein n=1 Tax=Talaromyces islandicus TaxID=28573 RepID=A0A0U1M2V1_TALIS|nr:hypothetical protein PISL3812_06873 [Talaromyces islandicus]
MLRLSPHPFSCLPSHPSLAEEEEEEEEAAGEAARPKLEEFLLSILTETQTFTTQTIPRTFAPAPKLRASPPSTAKVQLLLSAGNQNGQGGEGEYWVCRKSIHADAAEKGTATWNEFEKGLRENHSENEMAYTPSVASVEHLLQWPVQKEVKGGWRDVDMHVNMITHTFKPGALISPRTFISLVISAYEPQPDNTAAHHQPGFYTVQIPLSFKTSSANLREKIKSVVPKNTIFAHYASVEHVSLLDSPPLASESANRQRQIEWTMATTSDAGGLIPQWVQRSWTMGGVPKAVVADVGLFLGWTDRQRRS